jgi:hypothetical protein
MTLAAATTQRLRDVITPCQMDGPPRRISICRHLHCLIGDSCVNRVEARHSDSASATPLAEAMPAWVVS